MESKSETAILYVIRILWISDFVKLILQIKKLIQSMWDRKYELIKNKVND